MTGIGTVGSAGAPAAGRTEEQKLGDVARQLEGVFIQQLFKSMRATVPQEGVADGGSGEEMFTGMLDEKIADSAGKHLSHGLGDALLRQLRHAAEAQHPGTAPAAGASAAGGAASSVRGVRA